MWASSSPMCTTMRVFVRAPMIRGTNTKLMVSRDAYELLAECCGTVRDRFDQFPIPRRQVKIRRQRGLRQCGRPPQNDAKRDGWTVNMMNTYGRAGRHGLLLHFTSVTAALF
jgi:hypothetical protein